MNSGNHLSDFTPKLLPLFLSFIVLFIVGGCGSETVLKPGEGYVEVNGGKIWYRVVGEGDQTPVITLHGGPGAPSYYLNPLAALSVNRPVIFFDQLGCGRSAAELDTTLMTVENHVDQVERLRIALNLEDMIVYGHSWGAGLALEYYLKYPDRVRALIFGSPYFSTEIWLRDTKELISTLPDSIQSAIAINEEKGTFDSPDYQQAMAVFNKNFGVKKPASANVDSTWDGMNNRIYQYMWGPSEFTATGDLKNFERAGELPKIKVPTLFVTGEFDEAIPSTVQEYQSQVPGSEFKMIEGAAHLTMNDNPQSDLKAVLGFIEKFN